jgi:hypothetical protein
MNVGMIAQCNLIPVDDVRLSRFVAAVLARRLPGQAPDAIRVRLQHSTMKATQNVRQPH